ncbi:hypothetical protein J3A83DRAFT_4369475 [Scleroderma citrinum]
MAQTPGPVTVEIMTILPAQYKDEQVQADPMLVIKQESETPKLSKLFKSLDCDKQPVPTSNCEEKSLSSLLFNMPVKGTLKDMADVDDSMTEPESEDKGVKTALTNIRSMLVIPSVYYLDQG